MSGDVPAPSGVQRERTALAWGRTALVVMVGGALLVRGNVARPLLQVPGYLALAVGALLVPWSARRGRASRATPHAALRAVGLGATALGLAAVAGIAAQLA